jgi:hypothetical protein
LAAGLLFIAGIASGNWILNISGEILGRSILIVSPDEFSAFRFSIALLFSFTSVIAGILFHAYPHPRTAQPPWVIFLSMQMFTSLTAATGFILGLLYLYAATAFVDQDVAISPSMLNSSLGFSGTAGLSVGIGARILFRFIWKED